MNSKRSSLPKAKQRTPSPRNKVTQSSQDILLPSGVVRSDEVAEAVIAESSEVRPIQGYATDWQRWDQLTQQLGDERQATFFRYLMEIAEAQMSGAGTDSGEQEASSEDLLANITDHIPQLLAVMTSLTLQFQQSHQQQQHLNLLLAQVLEVLTTSGAEASAEQRQSAKKLGTVIVKDSFTALDSKDLKKSHAKGSAEEKLRRAFEAITAHNEAPERTQPEKWAVNQNALAELTGCNRPAIKQFLKLHGPEIERHHHTHALLPRHNYSHGKVGTKITDIIHW